MHKTPSPLRATTALGIALVSTSLTAAPPVAVGPEEHAEIHAAASSKSEEATMLNAEITKTIATDGSDAAKASKAAQDFAQQAGIPLPENASDPEAIPLQVAPGPNDTLIQCDGGMFFDSEAGVLVYLKNVRVTDPRFNLSGADELKIFFAKKTEPEERETGGFGSGFGDVDRIIATGAVRILQKSSKQGEDPVEASGGLFTYRPKTGEVIISGRYPWVKKGAYYARAKQPNLTLRILQSGDFVTEGTWDMGGNLNQNR